MSYEQFWDGPPFLVRTYRKAFRLQQELANEQAWLQGLYVFDAVSVAMGNLFRKRGQKAEHYLDRPIDIFPLTEKEKKRREQEEYAKMQKTLEQMRAKQAAKKKQSGQKSPEKEVVNDGRNNGSAGNRSKA